MEYIFRDYITQINFICIEDLGSLQDMLYDYSSSSKVKVYTIQVRFIHWSKNASREYKIFQGESSRSGGQDARTTAAEVCQEVLIYEPRSLSSKQPWYLSSIETTSADILADFFPYLHSPVL